MIYFLNVPGPCNVISVDWRKLADTLPFYNVAAANSKPVGYLTADLVNFLVTIPFYNFLNNSNTNIRYNKFACEATFYSH
jgi:hypothetical protein